MKKDTYFIAQDASKIRGTLTLPETPKKPPICLFIGGSFPLENIGIATFRYDKRGSGESEGDFNTGSLLDFLNDARSVLRWLKTLE